MMRSRAVFPAYLAVVLSALLSLTMRVQAATIQSNGTGGGDWWAGATWLEGNEPDPTDDVIIVTGDSVTIGVVPGDVTNSASITIDSGGSLSVGTESDDGALVNDGLISVTGQLSVFQISSLTNNASITCFAGGTINNYGDFVNGVDGVVDLNDALYNNQGRIENSGNINIHPTSPNGGSVNNWTGLIENYGFITVLGPSAPGVGLSQSAGGTIINHAWIAIHDGASAEISDGVFLNGSGGDINVAGIFLIEGATTSFTNEAFMNTEETGAIGIDLGATAENKGLITNFGFLELFAASVFTNSSGHITIVENVASMFIDIGATFINGFCGHLTNDSEITNEGLISSCGLIDGSTGVNGISGGGTFDSSSCGGNSPTATVEIQVTDSGSGNPIPDARVYLERVCLPMGTRVPFQDVAGGSANFFLGAVEPAQYEIKAFAPGYAPFSGRIITIASGEDRVESLALTPDPNAVNTLRVRISVGTGGNLVTDNFQVTQNGGSPFRPTVVIDGIDMYLVGLGFGATQVEGLVEGYVVSSSNITFLPSAPGTLETTQSAVTAAGSGLASGTVVFNSPPPLSTEGKLVGFSIHFRYKPDGTSPPGPDHNFRSSDVFLTTGDPSVFEYKFLEVNAATYYVVVANDQNSIISNVREVTVAEFPTVTTILALNITLPSDDTDGDGLTNAWEDAKGLNKLSSGPDNGAVHDKDPDGLTNIEEFTLGTHPVLSDTDGDGYPDGVERYGDSDPTNTNPSVPDAPPLRAEVFVRKDYSEIIQVGTPLMPVTTTTAAKNRVAIGGTIKFQNPGSTQIAFPGAITLGNGNKPMTLRLDIPNGPRVRLGATN